MNQEKIAKILQDELEKRQKINPNFSLRAFAKKLDISSGALSQIMQQKRFVSEKMARKLTESLGLSDEVKKQFLECFLIRPSVSLKKVKTLEEYNDFNIFSEWFALPILALYNADGFVFTVDNISDALGLKEEKVQEIIDKLVLKGFIEQDDQGKYLPCEDFSIDNPEAEEFLGLIKQYLYKTIEYVDRVNYEEAEFSSFITLGCSKDIALAKKKIKLFQEELYEVLTTTKGCEDQVYFLGTQLFPILKYNLKCKDQNKS